MLEFENDEIRIIKVDAKRGPNFPRQLHGSLSYKHIPGRVVSEILGHHTAGGMWEGLQAVEKIADYCIAPPIYALNDDGTFKTRLVKGVEKRIVTGGGRGWPGIPYTFVIPAYPEQTGGKLDLYRIWDDGWRTWHTGSSHNSNGVAFVVGGWYASRHDLLNQHAHDRPTAEAMVCVSNLVDYLSDRYRLPLTSETLLSHADVGKPACPGDFLENWIREKRGDEPIRQLGQAVEDQRPLETVAQIQAALHALGYDPGKIDNAWGPFTANALRAFQRAEHIKADGIFGPVSRQAIRQALAR